MVLKLHQSLNAQSPNILGASWTYPFLLRIFGDEFQLFCNYSPIRAGVEATVVGGGGWQRRRPANCWFSVQARPHCCVGPPPPPPSPTPPPPQLQLLILKQNLDQASTSKFFRPPWLVTLCENSSLSNDHFLHLHDHHCVDTICLLFSISPFFVILLFFFVIFRRFVRANIFCVKLHWAQSVPQWWLEFSE